MTLRVVDVLGREVASLLRGAGAYFLVLDADGQRAVRPLTVLR